MKAFVVFESLWGNTAAIARAVGDGIGPDARCLTTEVIADADLIVAGGPVLGFRLGGEQIRAAIARDEVNAPKPPDLSHPSLRSWLDGLPHGSGKSAAFETRIWWSPRGATGDIESRLERAGYHPITKAQKFVVTDKYGPLRQGELERAHRWGEELASAAA
jgi:hypothetical protein